ncbi:uncharacterized protein LOC135485573 isoform X2 [Lineus longissimus]|uniref:uncharacterized protein LOC135485573 isoform X2 n=1 Tax=Lineus longissimus TaxID=88925 RepID=UPI00315CE36C
MNDSERTILLMFILISEGVKYSSGVATDVEVIVFNEPNNVVMLMDVQATLTFEVTVKNNNANTDIKKAAGAGKENFHLKFVLSDVDVRNTGTASNILGIAAFDNADVTVSPSNDVQVGLIAGRTKLLKGAVKVKIPNDATKCAGIRYLCVNSLPKTNEYPEDKTRLLNNWKCKDVTDQVSCGIDVEAVSFTTLPTASSPLVGPLGKKGIAFILQIRNRAKSGPGYDIPAVSSPRKNFALTSFYSTASIPTATLLGVKANTLTISDSELRIGLPGVNGAGATTPISGSIDYAAMTATHCPNAKFVCVKIVAAGTASYTEAAATLTGVGTNTICHSLAGVRSCAPDPQPSSLVLSTNLAVGKTTTASFTMKIKNVKTTPVLEDVIYLAVSPNYNYKVELKLSDVDMNAAGTTNSLGLPLIPTTLSDTDRRKALGLNTAAEISVSGTAVIPLTSSACEAVRWLCAFLWPGSGAGYLDSSSVVTPKDLKPNTTCVDILNKKGCTPDLSVLTWSITPPSTPDPLRYIQDVWQDVAFTLDIKNIATGANSGIPLAKTWNYAVDIRLTDKDLALYAATVTNTKAFLYKPSAANAGNLKAALPVGSTLSLGGTVRVSLEKTKCNDLKYICAVIEHNALLFGDKDTTNNHKCIDISAVKVCSPDVSISTFAGKPTTAVQYIKDSKASAFKFDIVWQNVAPAHSGNDILPPPTKPAGSNNFQLKMAFSDVDVGSGKLDTLAIGKLSHKVQFPESLAAQTQTVTKTDQTYAPTTSPADELIIPQVKCSKVNYLCVYISEGDNAQYLDVDDSNNFRCISLITGNIKKNCRPVFDNLPNTATVNENEAIGLSVFTVKGSQGDVGVPSALQYTITTFNAEFQINPGTGEIRTKQSFSYETKAQYLVQVTVTDGTTGDPLYTATSTLTINIKDVNDKPVFDAKYPFTINPAIPENKAAVVHTMTYTDQDLPKQTMLWSIDVKPSVLPAAPFAINPTGTAGIISIMNPGLNFEAAAPPTYTLTIHMKDKGVPPQTATPAIIIVPCSDVPELPTIQNLPKTISLYETDNNNYDTHIFTVSATDPDAGTSLKYYINPQPFDGKFKQDPKDGSNIQYVKSPNFDHETTSQYQITVIVSDGKTAPVSAILTVKILNNTYGDSPLFTNVHWPGAVSVNEDQALESTLLLVFAIDPDNRPLAFSHLVKPFSGQAKFGVDSSGRFYSAHTPDFDYEVVKLYTVVIKVCASANCTTKDITVNVVDKNDPPICSPSSLHVTTPEIGTYNPWKLFTATDQDGGTLTYVKITKNLAFQGRFTIDNTGLINLTGINYETLKSPIFGMFYVSDAGGLTCYFALTVHITDINERPSFTKTAYTATVTEGSTQGTSLTVVTAKDPDIGENGILRFYVDPLDANMAYNYFQTVKITATIAHLSVQSPIDREAMIGNTMTFKIYVEDKGKLRDTATVTVTVNNINDNRPTFLKGFYNFEIMYNDVVGKEVGLVSCTDKDVFYNTVSYLWLQDQQKDNFTMGRSTGKIASAVTPLDPDREYVLIAQCQDNDPVKIETSLTQAIRVDTYIGWKVLTNWTTAHSPAYYKIKANLDSFLTAASSLCTPCVAKLHSIVDSKSGAILILYFLKDSSTDKIGNIGKEKVFFTASHIVRAYTKDNLEEPASSITANAKFATHKVTSITRYGDEPVVTDWMLDTIGGNIVLGLIMSLGLILGIVTSLCIAKRFGKSTMAMNQRLDDPQAPYKRKMGRVQPHDRPTSQSREASTVSVSHVKVMNDIPCRPPPSIPHHQAADEGKYNNPSPRLYTAPNEPIYQQTPPFTPPADFFNEVNRRFLIRPGKFKTAL